MNVLWWPERALRWAMFSIGFKELIDKLEEYFGKRVVKVFLGLVGVFAGLFIVGVGVQASVYPLALWLGSIITGQPAVGEALSGFGAIVSVLWIIMVGALIIWAFRAIRLMRYILGPDGRQLLEKVLKSSERERAKELLAEAQAIRDKAAKNPPSSDPGA